MTDAEVIVRNKRPLKPVSWYIGLGAVALVALSPLLRRLYFARFWVRARGTVIRLEGGISTNPHAGGAWVWAPVIEYHAAGQRFTSRFSYWQRLNARSKYSVGDEVDILYSPHDPSRFILDSWIEHIVLSVFIGGLIVARLSNTG
jgi:hypothetical protein